MTPLPSVRSSGPAKRVDLHCHSRASTEADEALLLAIHCPESYSEPQQIFDQALSRNMDFVTITDHDSIAGVMEIADRPNVLVGEELTCWFPEDNCKMHVLVWGINSADHAALQELAPDIYKVAGYVAEHCLAHAVAHPLYRQDGKLDRWHVERLLLLFKGFECLNGAHSMIHRQAFEPLLNELDEPMLRRLQRTHAINPRWHEPWVKSRTGGSDDHGLFNIGKTWTEFPAGVSTPADVLDCLRNARCQPGGEAGSSIKLAHNFFGVGIRYYTRQFAGDKSSSVSALLERLVGDRPPPGKAAATLAAVKLTGQWMLGRARRVVRRPASGGTALLSELFAASAARQIGKHRWLVRAMGEGRAPLAEHDEVFSLISELTRDIAQGLGESGRAAHADGQIGAFFDLVSPILAQQAMLTPYYFALFHQNQERHLLSKITGHGGRKYFDSLRVGLFSDTTDPTDPAGQLTRRLAAFAERKNLPMVLHTCDGSDETISSLERKFRPLLKQPFNIMGAQLVLPPLLEVLEWSDRRQFDVVMVNTSGPMALCGWMVAKMLRIPFIAAFNRDMPTEVFGQTHGDYRTTGAAKAFARWFYNRATRIFARSRAGQEALRRLDPALAAKISIVPPNFEPESNPPADRLRCWEPLGIREPLRVICPGNLTSLKEMQLAADAFRHLRSQRNDAALVVVGEGKWTTALQERCKGLPVYVAPSRTIAGAGLYAGGDLLLWPSREDITGNAALDAQAMGLPALVRRGGAAAEFVDEDVTGRVLDSEDPAVWGAALVELLGDEPRRQRMARTARQRISRFANDSAVEAIWSACLQEAAVYGGESPQRPPATDPSAAEVIKS